MTHAEYAAECIRWANMFLGLRARNSDTPFHVGVLLDTGKNVAVNVYGMAPDDVGYIAMPLGNPAAVGKLHLLDLCVPEMPGGISALKTSPRN